MTLPQTMAGMSAIADRFDAFLIDQFGMLRDGHSPYQDAAATPSALRQAGKIVIVLANSGKRSAENSERLAKLGFNATTWNWFFTFCEVAWRLLSTESKGPEPLPKSCLLISRDGDTSPIDGLPMRRVDNGAEADVILLAASGDDLYSLDHHRALLETAARRGVPCLCTNPEKVMLTRKGSSFGAGRIAELYQAMGGRVHWIGKPFPDIYATARDYLAGILTDRICCVGDSIEHDIVGGRRAGLYSVSSRRAYSRKPRNSNARRCSPSITPFPISYSRRLPGRKGFVYGFHAVAQY